MYWVKGSTMETIGDRLRGARKARKVTQMELAMRTRIAHSTLVRIERGQAKPRLETLWKLAEALEVDPKWLAFGDKAEGIKQ
jgi:transcriptional regulator with XRE-family HTH domain